MSLVSIAARIIFTRLVRGQTLAGNAVLNAPLDPIEDVIKGSVAAVAVYTGVIKGKPNSRDLLGARGDQLMELVFQVYIPAATDPTGELADIVLRGSGAAMALDLLQRQTLSALQAQNSDWSALWAVLVRKYIDFDSKPVLIEVEGGVRIPCREVSLTCEVISDPASGAPLNGFWMSFDGMLRDAGEVVVADLMKAAIERPGDLSIWRQIMALGGLSRTEVVNAGLGPMEPALAGDPDPAPLSNVEVDPATIETVVPPGLSSSGEPTL